MLKYRVGKGYQHQQAFDDIMYMDYKVQDAVHFTMQDSEVACKEQCVI